jgi:hypothetical protein
MLSGGPGRRSRREGLFHTYPSSRKDAEMLKITDSGCGQHQARHLALTGVTAALVGRLIFMAAATTISASMATRTASRSISARSK